MVLVEVKEDARLQEVEQLYMSAFPKSERKPFSLIVEKSQENHVDIWRLENEQQFCGLVITMNHADLVLIDYLAILSEKRGCGYGTKALELIRDAYKGRKVFLEIESTEVSAENHVERVKRKNFYLKNGLWELGMETLVFLNEYEILTFDKKLTFEEYKSVYTGVYGEKVASNVKCM